MIRSEPAHRAPSPSAVAALGITVYGCGPDEAVVFGELAPRLGVVPALIDADLTEANAGLAAGSRCVSVGHKARIANRALLALRRAGVEYLSTRSIGFDHIDVAYAERVGLCVGNVAYSPDSVADYTLMLMLMLVRNARSVIRRADVHDYRLHEARGRELRDLTVGVVGTGRIGAAVIGRLRGFGSRILAYDTRPGAEADHVPLDALLRRSDVVTLHTPLTAQTRHLLDRRRIATMRPGAFVVNTGRGGLVDTEALTSALERGWLGGAALDVLEGEEGVFYADCRDQALGHTLLPRLRAVPNAIVSPHTAYYTDHALRDTVESSIANCITYVRGDRHE